MHKHTLGISVVNVSAFDGDRNEPHCFMRQSINRTRLLGDDCWNHIWHHTIYSHIKNTNTLFGSWSSPQAFPQENVMLRRFLQPHFSKQFEILCHGDLHVTMF